MAYEENMNYAGFWKRFAAGFIDVLILLILNFILRSALIDPDLLVHEDASTYLGYLWSFIWFNIVSTLAYWIYCAAFESSSKQATLGKMALGIKVTDLNGKRIGFGKATSRYFGRIVSVYIFFIGCIMIAFTEKKQGLHDKMAGCLVVNK